MSGSELCTAIKLRCFNDETRLVDLEYLTTNKTNTIVNGFLHQYIPNELQRLKWSDMGTIITRYLLSFTIHMGGWDSSHAIYKIYK